MGACVRVRSDVPASVCCPLDCTWTGFLRRNQEIINCPREPGITNRRAPLLPWPSLPTSFVHKTWLVVRTKGTQPRKSLLLPYRFRVQAHPHYQSLSPTEHTRLNGNHQQLFGLGSLLRQFRLFSWDSGESEVRFRERLVSSYDESSRVSDLMERLRGLDYTSGRVY